MPASGSPLTLHARLRDGTEIAGQSRVMRARGIERVWLEPADARASREAVRAIGEADLVVLGPGSLYTSLLATALVPELRAALAATPALRVYVANVATQAGETEGYDLADHVEALVAHGVVDLVDVVLANSNLAGRGPDAEQGIPVKLRWPPVGAPRRLRLDLDDVVDPARPHHHDPGLLAAALLRLFGREAGARRGGVARTA